MSQPTRLRRRRSDRIEHRSIARIFTAPGEMAERCREFDWAKTPLGPIDAWSQSLRTAADAVVASRLPMLLFWGPELIQLYNDAFRPSLGVSIGPMARHPQALGMPAAESWKAVWHIVGPQIEGVMKRGEAVWFEDVRLPIERNGRIEEAWWTYSYSPVRDDDGSIGGTLIPCLETTQTIRARRELEVEQSRARMVLESMSDGYVLLDNEFRFVAANSSMVRGSGLSPETLVGRRIWDVFPGAKDNEWETRLRAAAQDRAERHFTLPYKDSQRDIVVDIDIYPALEGGIVVFWRNVTAREKATAERERQLRRARVAFEHAEEAKEAAEAANRAKSDFLAVMSHELRTPLNAIAGYVQLLEMGVHGAVTAEQRGVLTRIQRSQRHLLGLINGVLNYAKVDAGSVKYTVENVPMGDVLRTCEALILPQARAKGLQFKNPGRDVKATARADRDKVQQVIINLLSNAVKFTDPGGEVTLGCGLRNEQVAVTVEDTGRGIAPERLESAFHPFVQIDAKLSRESEGVGLGLAISRDLARGMGGDLTAESEVGVGSRFTFTLPSARE